MERFDAICIIDDDPIFIYTIKKNLEKSGAAGNILVYSNGKVAYDGLTNIIANGGQRPKMILLDLNMPVWDGWTFLDEFTKIPNEETITIYIVTSSIDPADKEKARLHKTVKNFVIKPIGKDQLTRMIAEA